MGTYAGLRGLLMTPLRTALDSSRFPQEQYTDPPGDPGLFGPGSVAWKVHSDPLMIVGGVGALMLQTLHPLAMAGVAEHSDFRERPYARLSRTASFVTATTFGSTEVARSVIDSVKAVHRRVVGTAPDGRPYAAGDPDLLRWVHVAEVASFLESHVRYHPFPLRGDDLDRYYDETAIVAEMLGATDVPRSRAEVADYFERVRPELVAGEQALDTIRWIRNPSGLRPPERAAYQVLVEAAADLLPAWARGMLGIRRIMPVAVGVVRPATWVALRLLKTIGGTPIPIRQAKARAEALTPIDASR
ncbi:MAG: oxygenase MpaB family protein [Actinomycetota bacterium]